MTLKSGRGSNVKYLPMAFTEHGAIMAATILNSPRAEQMSVYVVRAFVKMRESLTAHTELARELSTLKGRVDAEKLTITLMPPGLSKIPRPVRLLCRQINSPEPP